MLYNVYYSKQVNGIGNYLLGMSMENLENFIDYYNNGVGEFLFKGKTYNTNNLKVVNVYDCSKFDFEKANAIEELEHRMKLNDFWKTGETLKEYGKDLTEEYIKGVWGFRKNVNPVENKPLIKNKKAQQELFISYSDFDKDKVHLIVNELEGNFNFKPIVIASNREALKPLAAKVAEGIIQADIIIPILTEKSVSTQWINQEIGYATALNKKIMPIVERDIIDKLKGFIHKQIDLPYNYSSNLNKSIENEEFIGQFRDLLFDLGNKNLPIKLNEVVVIKSELEKKIEILDGVEAKIKFNKEKNAFLNSPLGLDSAKEEMAKMFTDILEKAKVLDTKRLGSGYERNDYNPVFVFRCFGLSFSLIWFQKYEETCEGSFLNINKWNGTYYYNNEYVSIEKEDPISIANINYVFDRNVNNELCWFNQKDKNQYTSIQIVDDCLSWLIEEIAKKRLEHN
ncbi:MAG: toll/interleukin-1 receptor domain-containing protein [Bacteroidia bacterium]|nr:toll/interleukin-1 receptor domain-containing protein [Bacteroidia bacterium]